MAGVERVGIGYDIHRLVDARRLVLGGVQIAWSKGLLGHSDGDVVLHAVIDALLGAAGLPDIGEVFPDSDPAYKDADSAELASQAVRMLADRGWAAVNADITVRAEQPRLGTYKQAMRERMAALLGLGAGAVSVKAKTDEGLGPVGSGQAIACIAVVGLRSLEA